MFSKMHRLKLEASLKDFRDMSIDLTELSLAAAGAFEVERTSSEARREIRVRFHCAPDVIIEVKKGHVLRALERYLSGEISEERLQEWAEILILLDCFDWCAGSAGKDTEQVIADVLHRLAESDIEGGLDALAAAYLKQCLLQGVLPDRSF